MAVGSGQKPDAAPAVATSAERSTLNVQRSAFNVPLPTAAAALVPPITNRPVKISLAWDASPDHNRVTNYAVHYGVASHAYTNRVSAGTNLSVTISNLAPRTRYYFSATATDRDGQESGLSGEIYWPVPFTNFVTVDFLRRATLTGSNTVVWSLTLTNPPGDSMFLETRITQTNNSVAFARVNRSTVLLANTNQP